MLAALMVRAGLIRDGVSNCTHFVHIELIRDAAAENLGRIGTWCAVDERIAPPRAATLIVPDAPPYRARRLLLMADERFDDNGRARVRGLLAAGDPKGEVRDAWHAFQVVCQIYTINDA